MTDIRYSLEKYSGMKSRHVCPECEKRTLTRYIDNVNNNYLADYVGRCSREEKCAYHFTPKMLFAKIGYKAETKYVPKPKMQEKQKPSIINKQIMESTLCNYNKNNFAKGLYQYFNKSHVDAILKKYCVGTAKKNKTIFWQVNRIGEVRTGKIILYDVKTLKRTSHINWAHSKLKIKDFNLKQIYFGGHLLTDTVTPVAVAEGEKNAILGALHYPQFNWIAVGGVNMLSISKLNSLKNYYITLFPDKGMAYEKWTKLAEGSVLSMKVDSVIEKSQLSEGSDIADLVISIKRMHFENSPNGIIEQLIGINPELNKLIGRFGLMVE
ncbi:MAG: hypothetical protein JEZ09_06425 [Salinivirgaceae bacterium]|nr:hypothetical protein [Salinivirgaceae bacterium]